jgi:hypothetical protein
MVSVGDLQDTQMGKALKISDADYEVLREAAAVNSRSLTGQLEHWMRIGRAVERDPSIAYSRIEQALRGLLSPDDLDIAEQDAFFEQFTERMGAPAAGEVSFFAKLASGAGDDDDSKLYGDH